MGQFDHSTGIQQLLDLVQADHQSARDSLLQRSFERLRILAHQMFRRHALLHSILEADDVLQGAALRLHQALPAVKPANVRAFFGLASQQIRRELIDLARRHLGPDGVKARQVVFLRGSTSKSHHRVLAEQEAPSAEPDSLIEWTEFHQAVEGLPVEEREIVGLLFYQGMEQAEAAQVLGISLRTVKRRWRSAKILLSEALHGSWPEL